MRKFLIVLLSVVLLGGLVYTLIPSGKDAAQSLDKAKAGQAKTIAQLQSQDEGLTFELNPDNTKIGFSCAKNLAGKVITVQGGWSGKFGSKLSGRIVADGKQPQVRQLTAVIDIASLWSEHDQLTEALLTKGFFQLDQHPTAEFVSTSIRPGAPEGSALEDATHVIEGNFTLNGIEKSISFPAKITLSESGLKLHSRFSLDRKDFNVNFTDAAGFGLLTDENISNLVALQLTVEATADRQAPAAAVAATNAKDPPTDRADELDISKLPKTLTETIPATQVSFDLVLVPGDGKIPPLYFGRCEVTWDEFMPWVNGRDLKSEEELGEQRALKLRPSLPYSSVDRNFGMDRRPALGVSRLSAELYCKWLSEQTGKTYRLPTEKEWEHAYVSGGGISERPPTVEEASGSAVYYDTSWDDNIGDYATKQIGSLAPDRLGLHDMAGNVCEWVSDTGDQRVARGGHFDGPLDQLGVGRHIEDMAEWNRDYPNLPKSIWWFVNARWVGFRVVREIEGK